MNKLVNEIIYDIFSWKVTIISTSKLVLEYTQDIIFTYTVSARCT